MKSGLLKTCEELVRAATKAGAIEAEAYAERTRDSSVRVRDGEVEELRQAASKGVGLRVISGKRLGFAYGTDFSKAGLKELALKAVALARGTAKDESNALPKGSLLGAGDDGEYDPAIEEISPDWKLNAAREAEKGARAEDPRIRKFDSTAAGDYLSESAIASSRGASGESKASYVYVHCSPVAEENGQLQVGRWGGMRRTLGKLEAPEQIGRVAARKAARMLGARKAKTQKVPVIFDPQMSAAFIGGLAEAINGLLVHRKSSFLGPLLGKKIAPANVTLVDDATLANGIATRAFDGEGIASQRTEIIGQGVLKSFLYDHGTALKAGARSTGSASRAWASLPSIGTSNLYLEKGDQSLEQLIAGVKQGFFVTSMLGLGANAVTGDYSRGANGIWIENGELTWPVQEVTVAGSLLQMLKDIDGVGNDLDFRSSVSAPSLRFSELQVSGA
jgi:PmbA protein